MKHLKSMYLGTSIAISWAWGTSLILGMQIAQQKGLETFLIWATANCLTLAIFGILYKKEIIIPKVLDLKVVKIFTNLIQIFCFIIQMKILYETLNGYLGNSDQAYWISVGVSVFLVLWMYRKGLDASIFTDLFQGIGTILCLGTMAVYAAYYYHPESTHSSGFSDIQWGIWSACILLSGIMTDLQHWQRAKKNSDGYAFEYASLFFAFYLTLVFILSKYQFDQTLNLLLCFSVLGVTTSTIDSIAVALHRDFGKKVGTLIGLGICVLFTLLIELQVLSLWSYFGVIRVGLAIYILYWCYRYRVSHKRTTLSTL